LTDELVGGVERRPLILRLAAQGARKIFSIKESIFAGFVSASGGASRRAGEVARRRRATSQSHDFSLK
jgi:hypothetical protein